MLLFACSRGEAPVAEAHGRKAEEQLNRNWDLYEIHQKSNPDSAIFYLKKVHLLAGKHNIQEWEAASLSAMGDTYYLKGNLSDAVYHFLEAARIHKESGNLAKLASIYNNIGDICLRAKNHEAAILYFKEAKHIFFYEGLVQERITFYRNLASYYSDLKDYKNAEEALEKSRGLALKENNPLQLSSIYNTAGVINFKKEDYRKARESYQLSIKYADTIPAALWTKTAATNNIGETYLAEGNFKQAEVWLNRALELKRESKDPLFAQSTRNLLAELAIRQNRFEEAISILEEGLQRIDPAATDISVSDGLALINEALVKRSENAEADHYPYLNQKFATYSQRLISYNRNLAGLRDQLETISRQQSVQLAVEKYRLNEELGESNEEKQQIKLAFLIPLFLLLCALVFAAVLMRRNKRYQKLYANIEGILGNSRALRHLPRN